MRYLFVLAHPDDECDVGATIHKLVKDGNEVAVAIMVSQAAARSNLSQTLEDDESNSMRILGVHKVFHASFPNIRMNIVPQLDLVQFIEQCIELWNAEAVVTHHPADVNNDHSATSKACQAAVRSFLCGENGIALKKLMFIESSSATEWSLETSLRHFTPNYFVAIGKIGLQVKKEAMAAYGSVVRPYPHPSNPTTFEALAAYRGAQAGCEYAEAFECVFWRV